MVRSHARVAKRAHERVERTVATTGTFRPAARDDSLRLRSSNDGARARPERLNGQINEKRRERA
jgi:hypothetical protein